MTVSATILLPLLPLLLCLTRQSSCGIVPFDTWSKADGSSSLSIDKLGLGGDIMSFTFPPEISSIVKSSKSESRHSRTEDTLHSVKKSAKTHEWNQEFTDNGQGNVNHKEFVSTNEKAAERFAKELKAAESGESAERDQKLTQVNGRTVVSADSGKQSSFSNSGHVANKTEMSSESSSVDNRVSKAFTPPRPTFPHCPSHSRVNLFLLVHTSSDVSRLGRLLEFLDLFVYRLAPARVIVIFFNRRVLEVVDEAEAAVSGADRLAAFRQRLARVAYDLRHHMADDCNLAEATIAAERLRQQLRLGSPCPLIIMTPAGRDLRVDRHTLREAVRVAAEARNSFDQLAVVAGETGSLDPLAQNLLHLFSTPISLEFDEVIGGHRDGRFEKRAVFDALGRRICEISEPADRVKPHWPMTHGMWH